MFVLVAAQKLQSFPNSPLYEVQKNVSKEMCLISAIHLVGKE